MALDLSSRRALFSLIVAGAALGAPLAASALASCQSGKVQQASATLEKGTADEAARAIATEAVASCLKKAGIKVDEKSLDASRHAPPSELFDVTRIVDGDTIWIRRNEKEEKLRLLSVDTEEKLGVDVSPTKPGTVFGEECALWAQRFFIGMGSDEEPPKVGLAFPDGREARDIYGRLLCNVVLADGTDFNVMLVRLGKSPYFNKYGNSRICHEAFVAAQIESRAADRGIWDPETNKPKTANTPAAK
ncbi:MAG: thermonuclease family protein, partial [Planctomycetota bacterium]